MGTPTQETITITTYEANGTSTTQTVPNEAYKPPAPQTTTTTTGNSGSGEVATTYSSAAPAASPKYPKFNKMTNFSRNVLAAPIDTIQFDESSVSVELMQDLLFEDIGAVELANISRSDLIDGQDVVYSIIKNLATVRRQFNPNNIIFTSSNNDFFTRFGIDIFAKTVYEPYFDEDGNLVIEIEGLLDAEEIEVEILSSGTIDLVEEL